MSKIILREISESEYPEFIEAVYSSYTEDRALADRTSIENAAKYCKKSKEEDLSQGFSTPGNFFYYIYSGEERVGALWLTIYDKDPLADKREPVMDLTKPSPTRYIYVSDIIIYEPYRRRGYASAALLEAERVGRETGCVRIDLNVFARNPGAQALYKKLGYSFSTLQMNKVL